MSKTHARLSPSSADRWTSCTASAAAQDGIPNSNSDASRMGTTCHQMQEELLLDPTLDVDSYLGRTLVFWVHPESGSMGESWYAEWELMQKSADGALCYVEAKVEVTEAMVDAVRSAVTFIRERHAAIGGKLLVEQRVPIGHYTGEDDAHGSADVIILGDEWVEVMDSKFGRKRVNASRLIQREKVCFITATSQPEKRGPNLQMACYALGAVHKFDVFGTVERVTMTIVQPFIGHTDSYTCALDELQETEMFLAAKAEETRTNPKFEPNFENCFFCRAKGTCDAQSNRALSTVLDGFGEADSGEVIKPNPLTLGSQYALLPFVLQWAEDIEAATRKALDAGEPVVRNDGLAYKFVAGKAAKREWKDAALVEGYFKNTMRMTTSEMYEQKLISPAAAEKLATPKRAKKGEEAVKPRIGPTQWASLQTLIFRGDSKPEIALETDHRPAVSKADGFEDVK